MKNGLFLRRKDHRLRVSFGARAECRGVTQSIQVIDFSSAGIRIDKLSGLAVGDLLSIALTPEISVKGTIAWLVWHKAGVQITPNLKETDPAFRFLKNQASLFEQARVHAIAVLAQREAAKARKGDPA